LDPVKSSPEITREARNESGTTRTAVVVGFVADDRTGKPVGGTLVSTTGTSFPVSAKTDASGFYQLKIDLQNDSATLVAQRPEPVRRRGIVAHKDGYMDAERQRLPILPGGYTQLNLRLLSQGGPDEVAFESHRARREDRLTSDSGNAKPDQFAKGGTPGIPHSIRVGIDCDCRDCGEVYIMSMESYTKHCLPSEWLPGWLPEALKSGAIAIRSYGAWHVIHPITDIYDICGTACCQVCSDWTASSANAAVMATADEYMIDLNGAIARCEYSAENNDLNNRDGCGDGFIKNNPAAACLDDFVCKGARQSGHGRGMCQWGTQRWAQLQGKTYEWICDHYYGPYHFVRKKLNPRT
jgi:hypothetical protein